MKRLTKTQRQKREYNKLVGFGLIRDKYTQTKRIMTKDKNKHNSESLNQEFIKYCNRVRVKCKMVPSSKSYYERLWTQEYNKLKKK